MPAAQHAGPPVDRPLGPEVVLIPVKAFHEAKRRLGPALSDPERIRLVRAMASQVVAACVPLPVAVVCDDQDVAEWASELGAAVMWEPGQGLNGAVRAGVDRLARAGARWVTVAHGDLPRAHGLGVLSPFAGVTLVPDRRDDGTNVLRLPAGSDFRFAYGPGSFRAHRAEATRIGLPVRVLRNPDLAYDVDWPADVAELDRAFVEPAPGRGTGGPKAPGLTCSRRNEALSAASPPCGRLSASWPSSLPLLGRLAGGCPLLGHGRCPLLDGLAGGCPLLGRGRCPLLDGLAGGCPLLGRRLLRARFLTALRAVVRFLAALRAGARFTDFLAGARLTALFAVERFAAFFAGARFFAAFLAGALLFAATATGAPP